MQFRLAHQWSLNCDPETPRTLVREFLRPAVRAVPSSMAHRLGQCRISLDHETRGDEASRWTLRRSALDVWIAFAGIEEHDVAMEVLLCLGQALWDRLSDAELRIFWKLLQNEILTGAEGEIDEPALEEKRALLADRSCATSSHRLARYGQAAFAGTAAEYVHCLWHDVTVRTGPDYLPAAALRRRLELMARWFPPDRGYRLFDPSR